MSKWFRSTAFERSFDSLRSGESGCSRYCTARTLWKTINSWLGTPNTRTASILSSSHAFAAVKGRLNLPNEPFWRTRLCSCTWSGCLDNPPRRSLNKHSDSCSCHPNCHPLASKLGTRPCYGLVGWRCLHPTSIAVVAREIESERQCKRTPWCGCTI